MKLRYTSAVMSLCLLAVVGIDCTIAEDRPVPIIVGVIHAGAHPSAEAMKRSFEMAVKAKNTEGGAKGRPLKLVYAEDGLNSAGSIGYQRGNEDQAVNSLMDRGAVMLIGGYSSANTIHTAFFAEKFDIPALITTASDNQITQRGFKNVYRLNPPASEYAAGVEDFLLNKIHPTSMAIVYEASRYGTDTAARMLSFCRENKIKLTELVPYQKDRVNEGYLEKRLRPIQNNPPDVIYMVSYLDDAVLLVKALKELNIDSLLVGAGGGFTDARFIGMLGDVAEGTLTATLWSPQLPYPGAREYHDSYVEIYGEAPDYHGAEAYSAVFVVADVLERAESLEPEGIRKALDSTDLQTAFGQVRFRSYADYKRQNRTPTAVLQVENSKFKFVWPETISGVGPLTP